MFVEKASECPIISKQAIVLAEELESLIRSLNKDAKMEVYDRFKHTGVWRNFAVK